MIENQHMPECHIYRRLEPVCMKKDTIDNSQDEVSLKLAQVDIEGAIKADGRGDARDDLHNQPAQVRRARPYEKDNLGAGDTQIRVLTSCRSLSRGASREHQYRHRKCGRQRSLGGHRYYPPALGVLSHRSGKVQSGPGDGPEGGGRKPVV